MADVRQPSSGARFIGAFNVRRCLPASERNSIIAANPRESDRATVDFFETPTSDAVQVRIEGQALFRLNTNPAAVAEFYR